MKNVNIPNNSTRENYLSKTNEEIEKSHEMNSLKALLFAFQEKIGKFTEVSCRIENHRAGYAGPRTCHLSYTIEKIDDIKKQKNLENEFADYLRQSISKINPEYFKEPYEENKKYEKELLRRQVHSIPSLKELKKTWIEMNERVKREFFFDDWVKSYRTNIKQENQKYLSNYREKLNSLKEEALNRVIVKIKENKIILSFEFDSREDELYLSFANFCRMNQIKGTGRMPGGVFDSHYGPSHGMTPTEDSKDVYDFFLKEAQLVEQRIS